MIDTIRFKIPLSPQDYNILKKTSIRNVVYDGETEQILFRIYKKQITIGSHDYHINITTDKRKENVIYLEFSVPKFYYGHNIYLFYPPIDKILIKVSQAIINCFKIMLPDYNTWIIQRLDICYAWKFPTQEEAYLALLVLNPYDFSRKRKVSYDTSFDMKGSTYDLKFYLKYDEFKENDFKRFKKIENTTLAHELLAEAIGVLRIELSLRKKKLIQIFEKQVRCGDINNPKLLQEILREHFSLMLKHKATKVMKTNEILLKLFAYCKSKSKALNLYNFYLAWNHPNPSVREKNRRAYKNNLHSVTLWRKQTELRKAQVGILNSQYKFKFDFAIPSPYVVNLENVPPALAAEQEK